MTYRLRPSWVRAAAMAARGTMGAAAVLVAGALVLSAVQMPRAKASRAADDDDQPKAAAASPIADSHIVKLDRDGQEKGGISASEPLPTPFQDQVRAYGTVLALDRLTALYNAALTDAAQLKTAEVRASASRMANERAQNLLKLFPTARAQAETAEASSQIDAVGVDAAKAQIEALTNTAIQDWGPILGPSIVAHGDLPGRLVRRTEGLIQVSFPPGTSTAPPRHVAFASGSGASVEGTLIAEATQADPRVQTIGFLYAVPMSRGLLPGASVLVNIPKGDIEPGIGIPPSAVVWQSGKAWMYVRTAPDQFERRRIDQAAAATPDGGYVLPAKSLPQDQAVVVAGAQILLSQESREQIPSDEDDN